MEHSISMTRAELQAQLDQTSELCRRLTEALKRTQEEKGELLAAANEAIWAAIDVIPRYAERTEVPNIFGRQYKCAYCGGHNGGALGVAHDDHCIVGRALSLCRKFVKYEAD